MLKQIFIMDVKYVGNHKLGNKGLLAQSYIQLKCYVIDGTLTAGHEKI